MCGVAGILAAPNAADPGQLAQVSAMLTVLYHRGPDDGGLWLDEEAGVALGHRRLSIIDPSPAGHQPMESHRGRLVVTYNGELYNFSEVREELVRGGHRFHGRSDTEVMLTAFESFGIEAALRRFAGMFALGLWDRGARVLYLVRDRLGKKPLYVTVFDGRLLFASELKALLAVPGFRPRINATAMSSVLQYGWVPEGQCIWENVFKLPPAGMLSVSPDQLRTADTESLRQRVRKWWSLAEVAEHGQREPVNLDDDQVTAEVERLLQLAVGERMIADVPLGAFLSGGIDSSAVVALMQARSSRPVRTFTIGFGEPQFDEGRDASKLARHLGTEHVEFRLTPAEACAAIPELPSVWDEPFAAESQIPTLLVSRLARQHVKVALTGDGGDEVFAGYPRHYGAPQLGLVLAAPLPARRAMAWALRMLDIRAQEWLLRKAPFPPALRDGLAADKAIRLIDAGAEPELYDRLISVAPPIRFASPSVTAEQSGLPALSDLAARMMYRDSVTYLPGDILVKVDRASMAVSLETRCPLLDHRVMEFAWRLPISAKIRDGSGKWVLRRILRRYLPEELLSRPKHGFNVPLGSWLRGPLRDWAGDLLAAPRLAADGFASRRHVAARWQEHLTGRRNRGHELWAILMAETWLRAQQQHQLAVSPTLRHIANGNLLAPVPGQ